MHMRDMRATAVVAGWAGLLLAIGAAQAVAQSLGDVAKKEQERRKHVQPAGKVYTNKDLGSAPEPAAPPAGAADKVEPKGTEKADSKDARDAKDPKDAKDAKEAKDAKDAGAKEQDAKGQAYWAGRRKTLQDALDRDLTFADALQSRINALTADFVNRDDPAQRAVIERDRQKAVTELERLRKQIADDRKAIAEFEEEARRAGVPPGWLR
jgi:hypothetical protein